MSSATSDQNKTSPTAPSWHKSRAKEGGIFAALRKRPPPPAKLSEQKQQYRSSIVPESLVVNSAGTQMYALQLPSEDTRVNPQLQYSATMPQVKPSSRGNASKLSMRLKKEYSNAFSLGTKKQSSPEKGGYRPLVRGQPVSGPIAVQHVNHVSVSQYQAKILKPMLEHASSRSQQPHLSSKGSRLSLKSPPGKESSSGKDAPASPEEGTFIAAMQTHYCARPWSFIMAITKYITHGFYCCPNRQPRLCFCLTATEPGSCEKDSGACVGLSAIRSPAASTLQTMPCWLVSFVCVHCGHSY
ncbi:hypothetical protein FBU59_000838 [Linderina macrospora]|uniref:Uncharacterized protein n=1 Tax=Linderina macrospora TaxID=4868 RepID=A0ACC1JFU4_9FUNG|nr:hypothetical protein FBU59_000838 [Linderina macrospora]